MKKIIIPFFCAILFATSANAQTAKTKNTATTAVQTQVTAQQVIDKYIDALGGKAKLESVKSLISENSISVQGMEVKMVTKKMGNKFKSVQTVMGQEVSQTFDGEKGVINQMGNKMDIPADKIPDLKKAKLIEALGFDASKYSSVSTETLEGVKYNVLHSEKTKLYFDASTGLLYLTSSAEGNATIKSYMTVDGIKFAELIEAKGGGQEMTIKTTKVTLNSGVTDADFKI